MPCFHDKKKLEKLSLLPSSLRFFSAQILPREGRREKCSVARRNRYDNLSNRCAFWPMINAFTLARVYTTRKRSYFTSRGGNESSVASGSLYWIKGWMDGERSKEWGKKGRRKNWNSMVANEKSIWSSFVFENSGISLDRNLLLRNSLRFE